MLTTTLTKIILAALTSQVPPVLEGQDGQLNTIDGYSEHVAQVGGKIALPCNTSIWGEELISLVLWYGPYRETTDSGAEGGLPIYSIDARTSPLSKSKHSVPAEYKDRLFFDVTLKPPVLRIDPILEEDNGDFRCRVDYRESRTKNFVAKLNVVEPTTLQVTDRGCRWPFNYQLYIHGGSASGDNLASRMRVPPKEVIIMDSEGQRLDGAVGPYDEGSDLVVICEAEGGKPLPAVSWWSEDILLDDSYSTGPHGNVRNELSLGNLNRTDFMLSLTCRAQSTNLTVPTISSITLDMNLKPLEAKITTSTRIFSAGQLVELQCLSSGSRPPAQISWFKDNLPMKPNSASVRQTVSQDGNVSLSSLVFIAATDDNGLEISCRADNPSFGEDFRPLEDSAILAVHYAPQVRITLGHKIDRDAIREGTDVYFECIVKANPWVTEVSWLSEDSVLYSDPSSGIIISNQSLVLQKVKRKSSGRYWCVALNPEGQGESDELYLKVQFAPVCKAGQRGTYGVARNELAQINCELDADPVNVTFRWLLNNSDVQTEVRSFVTNGSRSVASYVPTSPGTYGRMVCWGENAIGRQQEPCVYLIVPASPPEAVHNCSVRNHSFNSLLVACEPGDNGGLRQSFFLEVYNSEAQRLHSNVTALDTPEFQVQHLPPGAKFTLNVYAANSKGRSSSLLLAASTLSLPQKQTHKVHATPDDSMLTAIVGIFIGVVATVSLLSILILVCLKVRAREERRQMNETSNETKKLSSTASHDQSSFSCYAGDTEATQLNCSRDAAGYMLKPTGSIMTSSHYQGSFNELRPVTYAELTLAPCDSLLGPCGRKSQHMSMTEYAQLDFERSKFRALVLDSDGGVRRSPAADGCSETEVSIEAPLMENLKPANYHSHDIIIRRVSPAHNRTATPV